MEGWRVGGGCPFVSCKFSDDQPMANMRGKRVSRPETTDELLNRGGGGIVIPRQLR